MLIKALIFFVTFSVSSIESTNSFLLFYHIKRSVCCEAAMTAYQEYIVMERSIESGMLGV